MRSVLVGVARRWSFTLCLLSLAFCLLAAPASAAVWYVNDTSLAGDSYTTVVGNDANNGLTPATPKRNIQTVMGL